MKLPTLEPISKSPEEDNEAGELNEAKEVCWMIFPSEGFIRAHSKKPFVAVGQLSCTNEIAQVLDDGDNLRVIPFVMYGAASRMDDLLYLGSRRTFGNVRKVSPPAM